MIVTEWKEFRSPDFEPIKARLKQPVVFDGRNMYDSCGDAREAGIEYLDLPAWKAGTCAGSIRLRQPGQPRARNRIAHARLPTLEQRTLQPGRRPPCRVVARHVGSRLSSDGGWW